MAGNSDVFSKHDGFTLIELIVTVLIISILSSFGVVTYIKSVENQKLTDATAQAQVIANANLEYYKQTQQYATGPINNSNALVTNNYLAPQNWSSSFYNFSASDASEPCIVSEITRKTGGPFISQGWGTCIDSTGKSYGFSNGQCPAPCPGQIAPATSPPPPGPAPASLTNPPACVSSGCQNISSVVCGEAYSDNCGNTCGIGASCPSGGTCNGGSCIGSTGGGCTPSCSSTLACGTTASNGCGGTCTGTYCISGTCSSGACVSGGGGGGGGGGCFTDGTLVMDPSGAIPIEKVRPGDTVYAVDPKSFALVPEKVRNIENKMADRILEVTLSNGIKLDVTPIHRFYDPILGQFRGIKLFKPGEKVAFLEPPRTAAASSIGQQQAYIPALEWDVVIVSIRPLPAKPTPVHNLMMDGPFKDYLVYGVLVHNVKMLP
ncbi:MAG: prepilin-type N-terminal cleavage/methylation domain-containing protein [Elusimicrobiota bacterium]